MRKFLLVCACFVSLSSFAQNDTLVKYLNRHNEICAADTASFLVKQFSVDNVIGLKQYKLPEMQLEREAIYADNSFQKLAGDMKLYRDGKLYSWEKVNSEGISQSLTYFYPNGSKNSEIIWDGNKTVKETGWDEQGNEIKDFVVHREAKFKGGAEGWRRYLVKNLRMNVPTDAGMPNGMYTSIVEFLVDKEGNISEVVGRSKQGCRPCTVEAVRVIQEGPKWIPAMMNNKPVIYRQRQSITFQVQ